MWNVLSKIGSVTERAGLNWLPIVAWVVMLAVGARTPEQPMPLPYGPPGASADPRLPPPKPAIVPDPLKAIVKIRSAGSGCTATILNVKPTPTSYYMMTASHCVRGGPGYGTATLAHGDGKTYDWKVVRVDTRADLCLCVIETKDVLPVCDIAVDEPTDGTECWHQGFGVDRPGNREKCYIVGSTNSDGMNHYRGSVSSGDSGGGLIRADNGHWVGAVCCGRSGEFWCGGVRAAKKLLTQEGCDGCPGSRALPPLAPMSPYPEISYGR